MNEFKLLGLKVNEELRGGIERFIVVESSSTFSGLPKPFYLTNIQVPDRVTKIQIGQEMINVPPHENPLITPFQREAVQRNAAIKDIDVQDDDVFLVSDIDEIFIAEDIPSIIQAARDYGFVHLVQDRFYYKLNIWSNESWHSAFAVTGKRLRGKTFNQLRCMAGPRIRTNGKHFSFLMTPEEISLKLKSFSHINYATKEFLDLKSIEEKIKRQKDLFDRDVKVKVVKLNLIPVKLDQSFPKAIFNSNEWESWIEPAKISFQEAKHYIEVLDTGFPSGDYIGFYEAINNLAITFPWKSLW